MLFIVLGVAAIASCILNGITFGWFQQNQNHNIHTITQLWYQDPIEKALLVDIDQNNIDCPQGLKEELISYNYQGRDALCSCLSEDTNAYQDLSSRLLTATPHIPIYLTTCQNFECKPGNTKHQEVDPILSQTLNNFFYNHQSKKNQKLCVSRIEGYSFAQKAPITGECNSDEKLCIWDKNAQMDDYEYCIPSDRECYQSGVQLPNYPIPYQQFPMIGFLVSLYNSTQFDQMDYFYISEQDLIDINNVQYEPQQKPYFQANVTFQNQFMPRVQKKCRESLKETLSNYIGPEKALNISIALLIISIFSSAQLFFYSGLGDFLDLSSTQNKHCKEYCETKRVNRKNHYITNICFVVKPLLLCILLILNIELMRKYIIIVDQFGYMIDNKCLDDYVAYAIQYGQISETGEDKLYNAQLTYAAIAFNVIQLFFDQNVYLLIKSFLMLIFCQCKRSIKKEADNSNNNNNKNKAPTQIKSSKFADKKLDTEAQNLHTKSSPQNHIIAQTIFQNEKKVDLKIQENKLISTIKKEGETKNTPTLEPLINTKETPIQQLSLNPILTPGIQLQQIQEINSQENLGKISQTISKQNQLIQMNKAKNKVDDIFGENIFKLEMQKTNYKKEDNFSQINQTMAKQNQQKHMNVTKDEADGIFGENSIKCDISKSNYKKEDTFNVENQPSQKLIQYIKKKTEEILQPPEAPAPAPLEQSQKLSEQLIIFKEDSF